MKNNDNHGLRILLSVIILLFIIGLIVFLFTLFNAEIKDATSTTTEYQQNASFWYNDSYPYRFIVTNVSGDVAVVNVDYRTGMQSDFSDLKTIAYDNIAELTYVINSYTPSTIANINVTLSPSLNKTFYIYYGL